ncbi:hypothetical protein B7755_011085 [Streptomyces sp. NBS 14/10]|uniref:hypothetical protein n=1 Tax=Streptomyces sp. NBS 14/10 TaxID=1945643 RepID=UPI002731520F|nr:hypothetical protein [Streptomyces sp. NBS 14/10]KAK1178631.1 hypothetical protein B7755_011085 [Streptomyces sp. NBS 14/10]
MAAGGTDRPGCCGIVQVRPPADAGVRLAGTGPLPDAGAQQFPAVLAAPLADVGRQLTERIADLIARRDTLHRLTGGDRALLPGRACAILDRMPGLGFSPDCVAAQREVLVLEGFGGFLARLEHWLEGPGHIGLTRHSWEAGPGNRTTRGSRNSQPPWPATTSPTPHCWGIPPARGPGPALPPSPG